MAGADEAEQTPQATPNQATPQAGSQAGEQTRQAAEQADGQSRQPDKPSRQSPEQAQQATDPSQQSQEQAQQAAEPSQQSPGFGERGRMRRRARFLRKARELAYRDLGGLVFDLHRFGQRNDPLVLAKLAMLRQIDAEVRELEGALEDRRPVAVLREVGIAACPRCAAIHDSDDRFCPGCGLAFDTNADRPISTAPMAPPVQTSTPAAPQSGSPTIPPAGRAIAGGLAGQYASPARTTPPYVQPSSPTAPAGPTTSTPPATQVLQAPAAPAPPVRPTAPPVAARPSPLSPSQPASPFTPAPRPGGDPLERGARETADEDEPTQILRPQAPDK